MDENKLKVLKENGYVIRKCCGICKHGCFDGAPLFGTCAIIRYKHLKHSESDRSLSVNRYGICKGGFELSPNKLALLDKWIQFIEP